MIDITTTVTGVVIGGFTAPTYTLSLDTPPTINSRRSIVTGLGGTQTGVRSHAPTDPFDITVSKPLRSLPLPRTNPTSGAVPSSVGRNRYDTRFRKGTIPLVGQSPQTSEILITENIVAGAEVNDKPNLYALWSLAAAHCLREAANHAYKEMTGSI